MIEVTVEIVLLWIIIATRVKNPENAINRAAHKSTRYYIDEMHLLLKEEQTAAYTVEIWKRFRKWGGIPTGEQVCFLFMRLENQTTPY